MLTLLSVWMAPAIGAPLTIQVDNPRVTAVVLTCSGRPRQAVVKNGKASFAEVPKESCDVHLILDVGALDEPGSWTCTTEGCALQDFHHLDTTDEAGRINIWFAGEYSHTRAELNCAGGHRDRAYIEDNTAVFTDVPQAECVLSYQGGPPAHFEPLGWGTYRCELSGTAAVCTMVSRP